MITFKQYLTEARMAPLYHGTPAVNLPSIVKNGIKPKTEQYIKKLGVSVRKDQMAGWSKRRAIGVSLSRSMKVSQNFGDYPWENIVLELDQSRLVHNFKLVPFQFFQGKDRPTRDPENNEFEEFVITSKPIDFKYVTRIWIPRTIRKIDVSLVDYIKELSDKYGRDFIRYYD